MKEMREPRRVLSIDNEMLSIHSRMYVSDENGDPVYECHSRIGAFGPAWIIERSGERVAGMHRALALSARWHVEGELGEFDIHRRMLSMTHSFEVDGGQFRGAELHGNVLDRTFRLIQNGVVLAEASSALLSVQDHHRIEIFDYGRPLELMSIIGLVCLHAEHIREREQG